ncbi:hypothetical protein [Paludisphaera soli]|uniref:hypothetical protein n=1 Tax=Paludisphaera soli TaxID=2712865 RepID=UPI0013ECE688|nr:hypothetical protein [Paludisphaera soli]
MAKLFGAQKLVLQAVQDSPKDASGYVADGQIAQRTSIALKDVRDWIETLEGEGHVEVARTETGLCASITAKGRLQLGLYEPIPTTHGTFAGAGSSEPPRTESPPAATAEPPTAPTAQPPSPPVPPQPTWPSSGPEAVTPTTGDVDGFQVVLLIHGIRTQAHWGPMVASKLEVPGQIEVIPIRYGYFDAFRFWFPFWTRGKPIEQVYKQVRVAVQKYRRERPEAKLSIVAHSFGTYVVGEILKREFDLKIHRLILCGSVLPQDFSWEQYQGRFDDDKVVNECGKADIWPVLAQSASWGYGASGTHGFFNEVLVKNRFHGGGHGQYFEPEFVEKYWEPFIKKGGYERTEFEKKMPTTPWRVSVLGILPLKWLLAGSLAGMIAFAGYVGVNSASQVSPGDARDSSLVRQNTEPRSGERSLPPEPVLPEDIDIASASFMDYEGDARAPRLDLKLTNMGSRPAFITQVRVNVKKTWRLRDLPQIPGVVVPPGHNYVIELRPSDQPYQVVEKVSEGLHKDDFGRFSLQFVEDPWPASNTIYLADVELVANSDETVYTIKDILFLITMFGTSFPDQRSLGELIRVANYLGQEFDVRTIEEALRLNKRMLLEVAEIRAVKNLALLELIESAKDSSIGES